MWRKDAWRLAAGGERRERLRIGRGQRDAGSCERVFAGLLVEGLGGQVDAVGPGDCPGFEVDRDLGEVGRIVQRFQHAGPMLGIG